MYEPKILILRRFNNAEKPVRCSMCGREITSPVNIECVLTQRDTTVFFHKSCVKRGVQG